MLPAFAALRRIVRRHPHVVAVLVAERAFSERHPVVPFRTTRLVIDRVVAPLEHHRSTLPIVMPAHCRSPSIADCSRPSMPLAISAASGVLPHIRFFWA